MSGRVPRRDAELLSGNLVVLGDESRLTYHRVPKVLPDRGGPNTGLAHGRLNVTLRVSAHRPGTQRQVRAELPTGSWSQHDRRGDARRRKSSGVRARRLRLLPCRQQPRAQWTQKGVKTSENWRAVADYAIAETLKDPERVSFREPNSAFCYSQEIDLIHKVRGIVVDVFYARVVVSRQDGRVITAYPARNHC